LYLPAGLSHGPVTFKKVNKPVLFLDIAATGDYTREEIVPEKSE
jgi:hypothetical protein